MQSKYNQTIILRILPIWENYPKENIEWIIVDDGTDKIKDLVVDHPNVKYYEFEKKFMNEA